VNRDESSAPVTTIYFILLNQKLADPHFLNGCQIVFHAHEIIIPVTFVNPFDLFAGILATFITEGGIPFGNMIKACTLFKQMCAAIPRPAADALAPFQMIHISQIPAADRTVHSARGDQFFADRV
jgi:hypothetical protein